MKKFFFKWILFVSCLIAWSSASQAATPVWDGGASGNWSVNTNWDPDAAPVNGDTITIGSGSTVTYDVSDFFLGSATTLNLNGTLTRAAVLRTQGATINVGATGEIAGGFKDLNGSSLTFEAGAKFSASDWEQKAVNIFTFKLGASGFTAMTPGKFWIAGGWTIANATYNVDMANYTGGKGTITLVDFTNDAAAMDNTKFQGAGGLNLLNASGFPNTTITWNNTNEAIQITVVDVHWDGGGGDGLWTNVLNWSGNTAPVAGDKIYITSGATVNALGLSGGNLPSGCTVNLSGGSILTMSSGPIRLAGSTINVAAGSALTGAWWDLSNGTLNLVDGSVATMSQWEQKGNNTFNFTLSETGFTTLTPGALWSGNGALWANATYNINMANYNPANGSAVVLMDFSSHNAVYNGTFNPSVNITGKSGWNLTFDKTTSKLIVYQGYSFFRIR